MLPHVDVHGWSHDYWGFRREIQGGEKIFGYAVGEFSEDVGGAGATRRGSMRWATAVCSMALSTLAGAEPAVAKMSVITFWPVRAAKVSGVMNSCAARVITTWTSSFSVCSRRTSSAAL